VRALLAAAASYASLFVLLIWGALRGQSLVAPDAVGLAAFATWAVISIVVLGWIAAGSRDQSAWRAA